MPQRSRIFGAVDSLFGYDLFVSYSRRDGAPYAHALAERLEALNFSCFLDRDELPAGQPLTRSLRRALRRSTALVVVNTGQARTSSFVALEVEHFAATGRPIIPIVWSGDPGGVPWKIVQDRDLIWITEGEGVQSPSDETIAAIERSVRVTRRRTLATRTMLGAAAAMLLLTVTASVTGWRATVAQRLANTAQSAAAREGQRATEASALALSRKAEADRATAAANERRELLVIESLARLATAGNTPPETAILLASESIHRAEAARRGDRAVSDHALRQAIARAGGLPLLDLSFAAEMHREVQSTYVTRNGRWLAIGMIESPRRHLALYDLHRPDAGMIRRLTAPQSDPPGVYSTIIDLDRVVVTENASFAAGNATSGDEVVVWPEPVRSSRTKIADAPGLNHLLELSDDGHRWCVDKVVYEGTGRAVLRLAENDSDELVALSRDGRWVVSRAGRLFRLDGKPATPPVAIMELRARHLPVVEDSSEGWQPPKERVAVKVDEYQFTPDSRWVVTFGLAV